MISHHSQDTNPISRMLLKIDDTDLIQGDGLTVFHIHTALFTLLFAVVQLFLRLIHIDS